MGGGVGDDSSNLAAVPLDQLFSRISRGTEKRARNVVWIFARFDCRLAVIQVVFVFSLRFLPGQLDEVVQHVGKEANGKAR